MKKMWIGLLCGLCLFLAACGLKSGDPGVSEPIGETPVPVEIKYATQFTAEIYPDGCRHIRIADGTDYLVVPEGAEPCIKEFPDAVILPLAPNHMYVAASSAPDLLSRMELCDAVCAVSTKKEEYTIDEITKRMESGEIAYAGKYSAPDYELLLKMGCDLALESTMITHAPKIKEQLETLGIPVLTERSSYETEPLGRLEWVKLYGVLFGKEEEAETFFEAQCAKLENAAGSEKETGKTVAFFYLSSNGCVNIRKPGDYLTRMIEMAGGRYAFDELLPEEDNALSTININWEDFYRLAVDADVLIYNGTIDGGIRSTADLLDKNSLFADFKAVREGNVWCTGLNMFQQTGAIADVIHDLAAILNDPDNAELCYLYPALN